MPPVSPHRRIAEGAEIRGVLRGGPKATKRGKDRLFSSRKLCSLQSCNESHNQRRAVGQVSLNSRRAAKSKWCHCGVFSLVRKNISCASVVSRFFFQKATRPKKHFQAPDLSRFPCLSTHSLFVPKIVDSRLTFFSGSFGDEVGHQVF